MRWPLFLVTRSPDPEADTQGADHRVAGEKIKGTQPRDTWSHETPEEERKDLSLESPEGVWPCPRLLLVVPDSRALTSPCLLLRATHLVASQGSSPARNTCTAGEGSLPEPFLLTLWHVLSLSHSEGPRESEENQDFLSQGKGDCQKES